MDFVRRETIGCAEAIEVAKNEAVRRGWKESDVQNARTSARRIDNGNWSVLLRRIPAVFGGHALIEVSREGKVIEYTPGA
jgi:hypothetical protein